MNLVKGKKNYNKDKKGNSEETDIWIEVAHSTIGKNCSSNNQCQRDFFN